MLRIAVFVCVKTKQISSSCQIPAYFKRYNLSISPRSSAGSLTAYAESHNSGRRKLNCHCTCLTKCLWTHQEEMQRAEAGLLAPIKHFKHLSPMLKALGWHLLICRLFAVLYVTGLAHPNFDNLFYSLYACHDLRSADTGFLWFVTSISRQGTWL